jgi:hypothetical protein
MVARGQGTVSLKGVIMPEKSFLDAAWNGVTGLLKTAVPIAANAFIPGSGGVVSSLIQDVFGIDSDDPVAVEHALKNATPEQQLAFKEKVMAHESELIKIATQKEMKEMELHYADLAGARSRETTIIEKTGKKDYNLYILAWFVVLGFVGISLAALTGKVGGCNSLRKPTKKPIKQLKTLDFVA